MGCIIVVGYPSAIGGADTELWHVLRLWRSFGLDVRLIPTWRAASDWRAKCDSIDAVTIEVKGPDALGDVPDLTGATVVSFCNGEFLKNAHSFRAMGCKIAWVGCMTWLFPAEREYYERHGPFDAYVFQSEYQRSKLLPELRQYGVVDEQCFLIRGAFNAEEFPFIPRAREPDGEFVYGRLARADLDKWNATTWSTFGAIPCPRRRVRLMGVNERVLQKLGPKPEWAEVLPPCAEDTTTFLRTLHCLVAINGGASENWPRVGLEAMAAGVPVIAENQWGWREMIEHGRTGFLADSIAEFAEHAGRLANDEGLRKEIAANARQRLVRDLANPVEIWSRWQRLFMYVESNETKGQILPLDVALSGDLSRNGESPKDPCIEAINATADEAWHAQGRLDLASLTLRQAFDRGFIAGCQHKTHPNEVGRPAEDIETRPKLGGLAVASEQQAPLPKQVRILVGALSGRDCLDRRERCLATWAADVERRPDVDLVFLLGDTTISEPRRDGNLLYLPCPDDYPSLPQKTRWFCRWALENYRFEYLFKCDDDTYVCLDRLLSYPSGIDYAGCDIGHYASGGAGYLLSRQAAEVVAANLTDCVGAEDVLVGQVLNEAGFRLMPDGRFASWPRRDQVPRVDNHFITGHGWRDDQMMQIHAELTIADAPRWSTTLCQITDAVVAYGELGVGGARGHFVDGSDRVDLESPRQSTACELISAHAPSKVRFVNNEPLCVVGMMDAASWCNEKQPTRFLIDDNLVGEVAGPRERMAEVLLPPGEHVLRTDCDGDITRRYPVWRLRRAETAEMQIVMPTSNRYMRVVAASIALLKRFWITHPPVDILCYDEFPRPNELEGVRVVPSGHQADIPWTTSVLNYLRVLCTSEIILLLLDDYGLCATPDFHRLETAKRVVQSDANVASFHLTSMALPEQLSYDLKNAIVAYPRWTYSINLQAAIWRRASLINLLEQVGPCNAGDFELRASRYYNEQRSNGERHLSFACDPGTPLFLDSDAGKSHWVIPYHNLMHAGAADLRHAAFLAQHGIDSFADAGDGIGDAFNGDRHMLAEFRRLVRDHDIETIVETGTHLGATTCALAAIVRHVHSIEANERFLREARMRLNGQSNVSLHGGHSPAILKSLLPQISGPFLLYLDAHGDAGTPLLDELTVISESGLRPIIAIHDFYVPGRDFGFDTYNGQAYRWDWIASHVARIYGEAGFDYYYNSEADGARRGVAYIVPRR